MNTDRLYKILEETTAVYRKGAQFVEDDKGNLKAVYGYPHTNEALLGDKYEKVDMIFVDVLVDKEKAQRVKPELEKIIAEYPNQERLEEGPSYIELAPNLGLEQEGALRTMALGKALKLWNIFSGKTLGATDEESLQLAGSGILMIINYKPKGEETKD